MKIQLKRIAFKDTYTIGELFINGKYECDTLEDKVRDIKIYGETAIPKGNYDVIITHSQRFNKDMPLLLNVPNFEGIRIHSGNTDKDTHGCILVGINDVSGRINKSTLTYQRIYPLIETAYKNNEKITIEIS